MIQMMKISDSTCSADDTYNIDIKSFKNNWYKNDYFFDHLTQTNLNFK